MRIGEILYFSRGYKFEDIDFENKEQILEAFKDRIVGWYLDPAGILLSCSNAVKEEEKMGEVIGYEFAAATLIAAAIDAIARYWYGKLDNEIIKVRGGVGRRIKKWLIKYVGKDFTKTIENRENKTLARIFYEDFRNKLVHAARVDNGGQFYSRLPEMSGKIIDYNEQTNIVIVNTKELLEAVKEGLNEYIDELEKNEELWGKFIRLFKKDFEKDVKIATEMASKGL